MIFLFIINCIFSFLLFRFEIFYILAFYFWFLYNIYITFLLFFFCLNFRSYRLDFFPNYWLVCKIFTFDFQIFILYFLIILLLIYLFATLWYYFLLICLSSNCISLNYPLEVSDILLSNKFYSFYFYFLSL